MIMTDKRLLFMNDEPDFCDFVGRIETNPISRHVASLLRGRVAGPVTCQNVIRRTNPKIFALTLLP
jgi:hypothetical protein